MKSRKEIGLRLEVLEDRMTPSGAFGGAIDAGPPLLTPFNSWIVQSTSVATSQPAIENSIANFYNPSLSQATSILSQLQSFQATQIALIDQLFSDMQAMLQPWHINTILLL
jgi:hypothetical protein